ncbi:hypothetical protein ACIQWZ_29775 [Streptomyces sp. NPDC098077]|uniref:hypothetical protein n=1 Tax=Streptomyces sp. NPDC098077 TaxID=3366093 RepID=UPI003822CB26
MREPGDRLRRTRAGLLGASTCLLLGAVGHVAAGGRLPGATGLAGLFAVLTVLCGALSVPLRHRFATVVLALGLGQGALHLVFHAMDAGTGHPAVMPHGTRMEHMASTGHQNGPAGPGAAGHSMDMDMDMGMASAHTLAALGAAVCLIHGERVLVRVSGLFLRPLLRAFVAATAAALPRVLTRAPVPLTLPAPHGTLLARAVCRRGPPPATYA